jgi:hypothetical protein
MADIVSELSLTNTSEKFIISKEDYELVSKYKWAKYINGKRIIISSRINGKNVQLHHLLLGKPQDKTQIVIHKNGNYFDKTRSNIEYTEKKSSFVNKHLKELPEDIDGQHPVFKNYKADRDGNLYNIIRDKTIKGSIIASGYQIITVQYDGKSVIKQAHVFVYECFKGVVQDGYEIDHIDNNKLNNRLDNLQALTVAEHHKKTRNENPDTGKKTGLKLAKAVIAINIKTKEETTYASLTEASLDIPGSTATKICMVLKGTRKSHQGYTFRYKETDDFIEDEIWVCLLNPLFKGIEVSNLGRIKSKRDIITYGKIHNTYMRVSVTQNQKAKMVFVHRLVCEAFHGPHPDPTYTVDHIDRNRINNDATNLRWASKSEQRRNASDIKMVQVSDDSDNIIAIFETITNAERVLKIDNRLIKKKCETNSTYNGMKFEFKTT